MANPAWTKGVSGNPKGRSTKGREERYYKIAMSSVPFPQWKLIFKKAAEQAVRGDAQARKFLADYLLGPPIQKHELTGAEGGPIEIDNATNRLLAAIEREVETPLAGAEEGANLETVAGGS